MKNTLRSYFRFGTRPFRNLTIGSLLVLFILVGYLTNQVLDYNKRGILKDTRNSLFSILQTTTEGLRIWIADKKIYITQVGESALLVNEIKRLLDVPVNAETLIQSKELANVRQLFLKTQDRFGETGFFIINPGYISIGSMRDSNIGTLNLIAKKRPDLLERVFEGETVFVPPIRSDIYLNAKISENAQLPSTIFIVAPIRDTDGTILAALARRLDPSKDFSRVIQLGRIGDSGETYAFNQYGKLLSESRFDGDLQNAGLIKQGEQVILEIEIRDPGGNMVEGYRPDMSRDKQPFTYMAERAIRGEVGENMLGYRDYRGVTVYGVWLWDSMLGFGITTEIDTEEALLPYRVLSWTMIGVLGVVLFFSSAGMIFTLFFGERANRILQNARKDLEDKVQQRTADLRENETKLNQALMTSEAAAYAKTSFLANMSHEIRTPMNAIMGFSEVLIKTPLDPIQSKHINTIHRSAKALLALINDILDIAKLEEGRMDIEAIIFNLPDLIEDVLATLGMKAQEKHLSIDLQYDHELPNCFVGDPVRLRQVLINLMGNAIKFTDKGCVTLHVAANQETDFLHFRVTDTGIGIPSHRLDAIFSPFTQADTSTTRKYGGTGLGTTISRQIVECMKGKIWVESDEGVGSTFHFTAFIPQADCVASCEARPGKRPTEYRVTRALSILLAEDIPENAELVTIRLEAVGHHVTVAADGLQALKFFGKNSYDLVLMDVQMPLMDGLEATREMRKIENQWSTRISIIALSASASAENKVHCIEAGMDGFVGKPIDFNELFPEIDRIVPHDSGVLISEVSVQLHENSEEFPKLLGIDIESALKNWRDPERYRQSLINFVHHHQQDASLIHQAIAAADYSLANKMSHALKGAAGNLAITQVASIANVLNNALRNHQGDYETLIYALNKALEDASKAISQLNGHVDASEPLEAFDAQKITMLINDMLTALGTDDPDNIEPVLNQLKAHLRASQLREVIKQVENFSFRDAERSTRTLAKQLNIYLENEND